MAIFSQPLQRKSDGRYDMTERSDETRDPARAIGYCAGWNETFFEDATFLGPEILEYARRDLEERRKFREKYHEDRHATSADAFFCYQTYLLDNRLTFSKSTEDYRRCAVCRKWTVDRAQFHGEGRQLNCCANVHTQDEIRKAYWPTA